MKTLVKITKNYQITIPAKLRKNSALKEGDYLEADIKEGSFIFKPQKITNINPDQKWFWTKEWQKGEREADEDIKNGRVVGPFDNIKDALKALKED